MKEKKLINVCLILALGCMTFACKMPFGKTRARGTGDIKDPNTVCALLNNLEFDTTEYKKFTDTDYFCSGKNPDKVFYQANGDMVGVQSIRISVLPEAKAEDATKNAETIAQAVNLIWQKLLEQPLPDDIKQSITKGTTEKSFSQPLDVKVSQSSPKLDVTIDVPDAEKIAALRKMLSKPVQSDSTPRAVTTGLKAPEPCGYLEKSMGIAAAPYKASYGDHYGCDQEKKLINSSTFRYQAFGNQSLINVWDLSIYIFPQNSEDQKTEMKKLLVLAANDVATAAGASKLSEDAIAASISGETLEYTPSVPVTDAGAPSIKKIKVFTEPTSGTNSVQIRHIVFEF